MAGERAAYFPEVWKRAWTNAWGAIVKHTPKTLLRDVVLLLLLLGSAVSLNTVMVRAGLQSADNLRDSVAWTVLVILSFSSAFAAWLVVEGLLLVPRQMWMEAKSAAAAAEGRASRRVRDEAELEAEAWSRVSTGVEQRMAQAESDLADERRKTAELSDLVEKVKVVSMLEAERPQILALLKGLEKRCERYPDEAAAGQFVEEHRRALADARREVIFHAERMINSANPDNAAEIKAAMHAVPLGPTMGRDLREPILGPIYALEAELRQALKFHPRIGALMLSLAEEKADAGG